MVIKLELTWKIVGACLQKIFLNNIVGVQTRLRWLNAPEQTRVWNRSLVLVSDVSVQFGANLL